MTAEPSLDKKMLDEIDLLMSMPLIEEAQNWQNIEDLDLENADSKTGEELKSEPSQQSGDEHE